MHAVYMYVYMYIYVAYVCVYGSCVYMLVLCMYDYTESVYCR